MGTTPRTVPVEEWERLTFYEYRVLGINTWEFRCPICHNELRKGLDLGQDNYPEELAGDLFLGSSKHNAEALICPKPECRALLRLSA